MPLVLLFAVAMDDMDRFLDLGAFTPSSFRRSFPVLLEWNVFFIFCTGFLFANFPPATAGVGDIEPLLIIPVR